LTFNKKKKTKFKANEKLKMKETRIIPLFNDQFDLTVFLHIVNRTRWILVGIFVLSFILAAVYMRYTPEMFESSTVIQINNENSSSKVLEIENPYEEDQLAQIVELLKSKQFLSRVLQKLPLKVSYYNQGVFLSEELYKRAPIDVSYQINGPNIYDQKLYFNIKDKQSYEIVIKHGEKENVYPGKFNQWVKIPGVDVQISLTSPDYFERQNLLRDNEFYFVFNNPANIQSQYIRQLNVLVKNQGANTIEIAIRNENSQKAAEIVNAIAEGYLEYEIERKRESATNILQFIDQQTANLYQNLNATEQDILNFKQKNNIKDYGNSGVQPVSIFMENINQFESAVLNIDMEVSSLKQIEKAMGKQDDINVFELIALVSGTSSEEIVSNMLNKLQELLTQKEILLNDVTYNNHKILVIERQFTNQKSILKEFIRSTVTRLDQQKKNYTSKIAEYEGKIFKEGDYNEIELSRLERFYSVQDNFYQKLIEKKAEYLISQAGYVSKNTILETAVPPNAPVSPNRNLVIIVTLFIASLLSISTLLLRYIFYNELSSVQELEYYTKIPIIGSVPLIDMKNRYSQLLVHKDLSSMVTESFRTIRSNLDFYNLNKKGSLIAVSSTVSGEGKTFVAINLAAILALRGKRVIIIDMDLRKPKIHHSLNVENNEGMSRLLAGAVELKDVIHHTEIDTLDYITADMTPPNPSELIAGESFKKILSDLKQLYDYVLVDTSPIGLVADAVHLFKEADLPLYILKANYSKRRFIYNLDFLENKKGITHIGLILNGINMSVNEKSYQYGYGYGYGRYDAKRQSKKWFRKLFFFK